MRKELANCEMSRRGRSSSTAMSDVCVVHAAECRFSVSYVGTLNFGSACHSHSQSVRLDERRDSQPSTTHTHTQRNTPTIIHRLHAPVISWTCGA